MTRVAVLGLGIIGAGIARNLRAGGHDVVVWNRGPERAEPFREDGFAIAATPREAADGADVIVLAVTDDAAVREVALDVLEVARSGAVVVDTSTVTPTTERELGARAAERGIGWVDSPVTGGAEAAERGTLTLLCGGSDADVATVRPVLASACSALHHYGPLGAGQVVKAVNGVMLAGALLGVAEGVALARRAGLDPGAVMPTLEHGAAASWVLSHRAAFMVRGEFPPAGRMALQHKDLGIALAAAADMGLDLPGAGLVRRLEDGLVARGFGDEDISALVRALEEREEGGHAAAEADA